MEAAPAAKDPLVSLVGTLTPNESGDRVGFRMDAAGIAVGDYLTVFVTRGGQRVASARVEAGSTGTAVWAGNAAVGTGSTEWALKARVCTPAGPPTRGKAAPEPCRPETILATQTIPGSS